MFLGIDHLVIAVTDPDDAAAQLERVLGLEATSGGRHDALGTFNRLVWFGDMYVELIGVFDGALAERSWIGAPTLRMLAISGGLATWAIATDALEADLAALRAAGSDLDDSMAGERRRADGAVVRWRVATPYRGRNRRPLANDGADRAAGAPGLTRVLPARPRRRRRCARRPLPATRAASKRAPRKSSNPKK